ncbi:hypothetical protein [Microscilla marina]|uniref:HTH LytTR-type domain-containing protein n=1 Tax=Microscilla marina ATCC 23134 TaxID=313606 RepID=A2A010_MICM2|nr:hypothetical protein [Microscilla marina]EAY24028.1 hypothetical protein M23134_03326 [Microscilla marina ATCC 23134]
MPPFCPRASGNVRILKINQSYIVNLAKVDNAALEKNEVEVGHYVVPSSKRYRKVRH